ncbi:MAG TPA: aminotransferase class V-fold PLP-dependent enzyme, partial [Noviherbaspirillum sp.]|nr:aminotransferase class V-fold PLP-dependent enzyme [Noviherbaspirillum sp.]
MKTISSREQALALDRADELAPLREAFALPEGVIYLDGNSLGARPHAAAARAQKLIAAEWGDDLIRSWNKAGWFDMPARLGDKLAPLIGAGPGEVVVTDTTSVNLFKALAAALRRQACDPARAERRVIVTERSNFPTDAYIAQGLSEWLAHGYRVRMVDSPEELDGALDEHAAVLMLTQVNYRTGAVHDMAALDALAHARGVLTVWDLAHSAGAGAVIDLRQHQHGRVLVQCAVQFLG